MTTIGVIRRQRVNYWLERLRNKLLRKKVEVMKCL